MRNSANGAAAILALLSLGACASTPPVTLNYHLPRADAKLTVVQSIACNTDASEIYSAHTVTSKVAYTADPEHRYAIDVKALDGFLANTDLGVTLADDGQRLLGFNVTQAGQGSQIVDSLLALAGLAMAGASADAEGQLEGACDYIANNGKEGVLTLTYAALETFNGPEVVRKISVVPQDADRLSNLEAAVGILCLTLAPPNHPVMSPVDLKTVRRSDHMIKLRQPARMEVGIARGKLGSNCASHDEPFWRGHVMVPQQGVIYDLPIPGAAPFGKQSVTLSLSEAGALTSLKYGAESGIAPALGSAAKTIDLLNGKTDAERAAALDAQADLIAQQERLLRCRADPSTCPT